MYSVYIKLPQGTYMFYVGSFYGFVASWVRNADIGARIKTWQSFVIMTYVYTVADPSGFLLP